MLIKNIEVVDYWRQAKNKLYSITKILNVNFESVNPLYLLIIHLILVFPFISATFATQDLFPTPVSSVLRLFLLSNLISNFGIQPRVITATILTVALLVTLLAVLHIILTSLFEFCSRLLSLLTKLTQYFCVPLANYAAFCYIWGKDEDLATQIFLIVTMILVSFALIVVLVLLKFQIRLLRKKNTVWNLNNDIHVYALSFLVFKGYVVSLSGTTIGICFLSMVAFYFILKMDSGCIGTIERKIQRSTYYGIAATDLAVLISLLTGNPVFGLNIWILLLGSVIIYIGIEFYIRRHERLFLPPCTTSPQQLYSFYYSFKQQFKSQQMGGNKTNYRNIFNLHRVHCRSGCLIPPALQCNGEEDVQEQVGQLITIRRNQNLDNRLLYEIWNLERGQKVEIDSLVDKPMNLKQDFLIYSIERLTRDSQATLKSTESSKNVVAKVFYDLIYEIAAHYSQFYQQLARTHPKIDGVVGIGINIRTKVQRLKEVYAQLLKTRLINFKMIELYLQFFTNFVNEDVLDREGVARLMKVQQHMHFQDIAQTYLPTFTAYIDSGNLQNANSEAQKFLQSTRFELKYRNVADLLFPSLAISQLRQLAQREQSEAEQQHIYSFFKKSQNDYAFGRITIQERFVKQKKLLVVQIIKEPFSGLKNMFLIDENFNIKLMLHSHAKIKIGPFRKEPLEIDWKEFYTKYIIGQQQKLIRTRMAKVQTESRGCLIIIKRLHCVNKSHYILLSQIIVSNQSKDRKQSVLQNRKSFQIRRQDSKFQFHYSQDQNNPNRLLVHGYKQPSHHKILKWSKTLQVLQKEGETGFNGNKNKQFGKQIKTYRLFDGGLYNVDLQDRQGYNQMFEQHINEDKNKEISEQSSLECYIFLAVIILGVCLVAFSAALIIQFRTGSYQIGSQFSRYQNIQQFNVNFQRIISILRDQYSGLNKKYPNFNMSHAIEQSYERIQALKNESVFDSLQYNMKFQDVTMIGTLSQLVDVILAHVTQVLYTGDNQVIADIQATCVEQLSDFISNDQDQILGIIGQNIQDLTFLKEALLYSSVGIILILYFCMIVYCIKANLRTKERLADLMYISDSQARLLQENAQKMKYAVEMARKNFDVDTQNLLANTAQGKRRKNPKEAVLSRQIVYTIGALTIFGLTLHLTCLFFFSQQLAQQMINFNTISSQGIALQSLFSESAQLTNQLYYTKEINYTKLNQIRQQLGIVEHQIDNLHFSNENNKFISTLFFQNSCQLLKNHYNFSSQRCSNTCPGFTIINPFQLGLALYLNRQNYYFAANLTQNFAHTGIHSQIFALIFTDLTKLVQKQGKISLSKTFNIVVLLNTFIILIDCSYIIAFIIIYRYFNNQFNKIKDILYFFGNKGKNKSKNSNVEETHTDSDSEQQGEVQNSRRRNRRTTIQHKMQN